MLSDLLKDYVEHTLEYFDKYTVKSIQLSAKGVESLSASADSVDWSLDDTGRNLLNKEVILSAIKEDWDIVGSLYGEKYRVLVEINFLTPSKATVKYTDYLVITVEDNDEEEEDSEEDKEVPSDKEKVFDKPTVEDLKNSFFKAWEDAMNKYEEHCKKQAKKGSSGFGSIYSCPIYFEDEEDFL